MAHISRYGKKGWRAQVYKHGYRSSGTFPTKKEAQDWAIRKESELDKYAEGGGRTFSALCSEYLHRVTPKKRSVEWETRAINRLQDQIGDPLLSSFDSAAVARWRDDRLRTVSGSTVQREANLLRNMLNVARDEWRWQVPEAFKGVRMPKSNAPRRSIWTWQEIRRVLRAPRTGKTAEVQRAFHISLHTSLRLKEVLNHTYDPERRVIYLKDTKTGSGVIPVTSRAARILKPDEKFTVNPNEASVLFSRLTKELLIEGLTFHDARASCLTWLSRRMDVLTLSRISRHKNISLLMNVYYRESVDDIARRI